MRLSLVLGLTCGLMLAGSAVQASANVDVRIDFSNKAATPTATDQNGANGTWNTVTAKGGPTSAIDYVTGLNDTTVNGIITYTLGTNGGDGTLSNDSGANWDNTYAGPLWLDSAKNAASDAMKGGNATGWTLTFSNLDPNQLYDVEVVSSYKTNAYVGTQICKAVGNTTVSKGAWGPYANGYQAGNWLSWHQFQPAANGTIVLSSQGGGGSTCGIINAARLYGAPFPDTSPPAPIADLSVTGDTNRSVTLQWTVPNDNSGQIAGYHIRYATSPITDATWASAQEVITPPAPLAIGQTQTFTVTGLAALTQYYFAVKSTDSGLNTSNLSNVVSDTTPGDNIPPAPVTNLAATGVGNTQLTLTWTATGDDGSVGTASTYDIRYSTSQIVTDADFAAATAVPTPPTPKLGGSAESFVVTGLTPVTTYYFAMKVADSIPNWSGLSNVCQVTTLAAGKTLYVGLTRTPSATEFNTVQGAIDAASTGDTILIDPGTYLGAAGTMVIGMNARIDFLTIQGNGGRPVLDMSDTIDSTSKEWADNCSVYGGKGQCVIENSSSVTFNNLEWIHAGQRPGQTDLNGACIRVDSASQINLFNSVMRDGEEGILDTSSTPHSWNIQNCVFHDLGDNRSGTSTGYSHNLYIGTNNFNPANILIFKYNWSYNTHSGYCMKSYLAVNYIMYNRMGDEVNLPYSSTSAPAGIPSVPPGCPLDFRYGGLTYIIGNVLQNAENSADGRIMTYGETEIHNNYSGQVYALYNTILGRRDATVTAFALSHIPVNTPAYIANNVLVHDGAGSLFSGAVVNNSAMINSNLVLYEHQGGNPPAMQRFMYDANGYDCGSAPGQGHSGPPNTFDSWNVLNVVPVDPNTFPNGRNCSNTAAKMPLTGYQTLISPSMSPLVPGSNPLALPAAGSDGTSLTPTGQFGPATVTNVNTIPATVSRPNATDAIGAYAFAAPPSVPPSGQITSTMPPYIYEGWTVNLTGSASGGTAPLSYAWTQTAGQNQTLAGASSLNASFAAKPLTAAANRLLTFQFVVTDSLSQSSTPVTTSVTCYLCGDIDHDNAVILADLKLLVASWNTTPTSPNWNRAADLDGDNAVILADLKLLVANWNHSLP